MSDRDSFIAEQRRGLRDGLRLYTSARVSLGQVGVAVPAKEQLRFQLDHALARDAVRARLDVAALLQALRQRQMEGLALQSAVTEGSAQNERQVYLRRPDLGRRLHADSAGELRQLSSSNEATPDVVFVIADGLSALAVERHALPLLDATRAALDQWSVGPVCVVSEGRVAIGDEIGAILQARLTVMMIGERPGLSSPDSLGVYITWRPGLGRTDAERNCISNIRHEGLSYRRAAERIVFYMEGAKRLQLTGIGLKENAELTLSAIKPI
jgi:ethanolamine ammonia-lyase small subunit